MSDPETASRCRPAEREVAARALIADAAVDIFPSYGKAHIFVGVDYWHYLTGPLHTHSHRELRQYCLGEFELSQIGHFLQLATPLKAQLDNRGKAGTLRK